jgi:hypothetical protein
MHMEDKNHILIYLVNLDKSITFWASSAGFGLSTNTRSPPPTQ